MIHGPAVNSLTKMFLESWNVARNTEEDYEKYYVRSHQKFEVDGYVTPYGDSPLDDENVGENVYLNMINQAYDYLYITTPYLILDDNLQTALINAAKEESTYASLHQEYQIKKLFLELHVHIIKH